LKPKVIPGISMFLIVMFAPNNERIVQDNRKLFIFA